MRLTGSAGVAERGQVRARQGGWLGGAEAEEEAVGGDSGEPVMNIGTPAAGAVIVCRRRAPSRLLTVPSNCPAATARGTSRFL
jgi:hypothetical protein